MHTHKINLKKVKLLLKSTNKSTGAYITQAIVLYLLFIFYVADGIITFKFLMYSDLSFGQIAMKCATCLLFFLGAVVYTIKGIISHKKTMVQKTRKLRGKYKLDLLLGCTQLMKMLKG